MRFFLCVLMVISLLGNSSFATEPEEILSFWFGDSYDGYSSNPEQLKKWFGKDPHLDQQIRERFEGDLQAASRDEYDGWKETPEGGLALVILFDQFPRNMYRDTPQAFAFDGRALALSKEMIATGRDRELLPVQRLFLYLPFEHAESREMQKQSLILYQSLIEEVPNESREMYSSWFEYAQQHHDIIERFGRFPHRNRILGRESTEEEEVFLQQPGSSF